MHRDFRVHHSISGLFVFLLLGMFAVFSTTMVLLGARAYRNIAQQQTDHNTERIAPAYLRSMIRSTDKRDAYLIMNVDSNDPNNDLLQIWQYFDGEGVLTYLYCHDGFLREYVVTAEVDSEIGFEPGLGETVCPLDSMTFDIDENDLMHAKLIRGGEITDVYIYLHSTYSDYVN